MTIGMRALMNKVSVLAANITVSVALFIGIIMTGKSFFSVALTHYHTTPHFDALKIYLALEQHCEKRRNCLKQVISPFLTMFSTLYDSYYSKCTLKCRLQFLSGWTSLKFCRLVTG